MGWRRHRQRNTRKGASMSTPQEYWDACLIRTWRRHGSYIDAVSMFKSITGIDLMDESRYKNRTILRTPKTFFPAHTGIRIFVAEYLPKVSERLFNQSPDKDVDLLRKLSKSKYDTEEKAFTTYSDQEHKSEIARERRNAKKVMFGLNMALNRNQATDWNVVKGSVKIKARR